MKTYIERKRRRVDVVVVVIHPCRRENCNDGALRSSATQAKDDAREHKQQRREPSNGAAYRWTDNTA